MGPGIDAPREPRQRGLNGLSIFLGMAYVTLVWLRAHFHFDEKTIAEAVKEAGGFDCLSACGPRAKGNSLSPEEYLRLIRNALAHSRVEFSGKHFVFTDKREREKAPTCVKMTWPQLGKLTEATIFAIQDLALSRQSSLILSSAPIVI